MIMMMIERGDEGATFGMHLPASLGGEETVDPEEDYDDDSFRPS